MAKQTSALDSDDSDDFPKDLLPLPPVAWGERTGLAIRTSARERGNGIVLSTAEKKLVGEIAWASEKRSWAAKSFFAGYGGSAVPVYTAALQHYAGSTSREQRSISSAGQTAKSLINRFLRWLYVSLQSSGTLLKWRRFGCIEHIGWDDILGSARIAAAADAGDAATLDEMNSSNLSIEVHHIHSAMSACWGWGDRQHKAAKYFFDLLPKFWQTPTVISFTSLLRAYCTASLQEVLSACENMKPLQIAPDTVFAET